MFNSKEEIQNQLKNQLIIIFKFIRPNQPLLRFFADFLTEFISCFNVLFFLEGLNLDCLKLFPFSLREYFGKCFGLKFTLNDSNSEWTNLDELFCQFLKIDKNDQNIKQARIFFYEILYGEIVELAKRVMEQDFDFISKYLSFSFSHFEDEQERLNLFSEASSAKKCYFAVNSASNFFGDYFRHVCSDLKRKMKHQFLTKKNPFVLVLQIFQNLISSEKNKNRILKWSKGSDAFGSSPEVIDLFEHVFCQKKNFKRKIKKEYSDYKVQDDQFKFDIIQLKNVALCSQIINNVFWKSNEDKSIDFDRNIEKEIESIENSFFYQIPPKVLFNHEHALTNFYYFHEIFCKIYSILKSIQNEQNLLSNANPNYIEDKMLLHFQDFYDMLSINFDQFEHVHQGNTIPKIIFKEILVKKMTAKEIWYKLLYFLDSPDVVLFLFFESFKTSQSFQTDSNRFLDFFKIQKSLVRQISKEEQILQQNAKFSILYFVINKSADIFQLILSDDEPKNTKRKIEFLRNHVSIYDFE